MASKSFFRVKADIKKPTQRQIELVRRRALKSVKHGKGDSQQLNAKSIESMLRIVTGRYSDLLSTLETEYRKVDHRLDAKFAQGAKEAKAMLIKVERDVNHLESMGYDRKTSGIDYEEAVTKLRTLTSKNSRRNNREQAINLEETGRE